MILLGERTPRTHGAVPSLNYLTRSLKRGAFWRYWHDIKYQSRFKQSTRSDINIHHHLVINNRCPLIIEFLFVVLNLSFSSIPTNAGKRFQRLIPTFSAPVLPNGLVHFKKTSPAFPTLKGSFEYFISVVIHPDIKSFVQSVTAWACQYTVC